MIQLTDQPIDPAQVLAQVHSTRAGAVVLFLGTTRELTAGRRTASLDYTCYRAMAEKKMTQLVEQASQRWDLVKCLVVHRLGHLLPGEASVAVAVSSAHRRPAFEAGQWLIDTLKEEVPIWKCENWADGSRQWVHPGTDLPPEPESA